jgi:hypothetical protein
MDRQEGYYWVKYDGDFIIAYCYRCGMGYNVWNILNKPDEEIIIDSDLDYINEVRIKQPDELPD